MSWEDDLADCYNPDAAARLLTHAAELLLRGEALPPALAKHIADAFTDAAGRPTPKERAEVLARDLGLVGREGRPRAKVTAEDVLETEMFMGFEEAERTGTVVLSIDKAELKRRLMAWSGVSEATIRNRLKEAEALQAQRTAESAAAFEAWIDVMTPEEMDYWLGPQKPD